MGKGGVCFGLHAHPVFWNSVIVQSHCPYSLDLNIGTLLSISRDSLLIDLRKHGKRARVHFIPNLKVGVFVTLYTHNVIKKEKAFSLHLYFAIKL